MYNNLFGNFNNNNFRKRAYNPEIVFTYIADLLRMDGIADVTFGSMLEDKHTLDLCKSAAPHLPENNIAPVKTDEFTREIKIAIEDCFIGTVINTGLDSICYILPDKTVFKIQITKL